MTMGTRLSLALALLLAAAVPHFDAVAQTAVSPAASRADTVRLGYSVSGTVTDSRTGKALESVHVTLPGRYHATVTNADGRYVLKSDTPISRIIISHVGYRTVSMAPQDGNMRIRLTPEASTLDPATVISGDPWRIVNMAVSKIIENYPRQPELTETFYRETIRKKQRYVFISEAVARLYKTGYNDGVFRDRAALEKSRVLLSQRRGDTLSVKLMGGPTQALGLDVVKNDEMLFNAREMERYRYELAPSVTIDGVPHFVVAISPIEGSNHPLYYGKLYIDSRRLSFTRIELSLDMSDTGAVTQQMLVRKPPTMRFTPKELSVTVAYRTGDDGLCRLSYFRSVIRFSCDWRKKFFHTSYASVNELVVTDMIRPAVPIARNEMFRFSDIMEEKAAQFSDPEFWKDFNIIEPSESLEHAIDRLRR